MAPRAREDSKSPFTLILSSRREDWLASPFEGGTNGSWPRQKKRGAITIDLQDVTPGQLADLIFDAADEEKAQDLVILDVVELTTLCDFFVICHGLSLTHVASLASEVIDKLDDEHGIGPRHRQSTRDAKWILLDYGSVIFHIFSREARDFYNLENLWGAAAIARRQPEGESPNREVEVEAEAEVEVEVEVEG